MKKYLIATLVLTGFTLHAFDTTLEFRHIESGGVGYNQGYSTIEFIGNQNWNKCELLLDIRGHVFNNGRLAGNAGIGVRKPFKSERYLFGLNAFYDVRNTANLTAQQVGVGAEWLSAYADIRLNGYIPFSKQSDFDQRTFSAFSGNDVYVKQRAEIALPCGEVEIGVPIKSIFYLAGGPYYLFKKTTHHMDSGNAWGGKIRAVLDVTDFLALSGIVSYDPIFHTKVQGYISFNISLEKLKKKKTPKVSTKSYSRNLRNVAIARNEIIPIEKKHRTVPLSEISSKGDLLSIIFVDNSFQGVGLGTFEAPFTSLKEAEQGSKPGDIIYVLPGDGTSHNMEEGIILKPNQTLTSSGAALEINEVIIPPQTPGQKPVITNIHSDQPVVTHAEGSYFEDAFTVIDPADYIFSDWDSPSYEVTTTTDLLGGDSSGAVTQNFDDTDFGNELTFTDNNHTADTNPVDNDAGDHGFTTINAADGDDFNGDDLATSPIHVTGSEGDGDTDSQDSFDHITAGEAGDTPAAPSSSWWPW